MCFPVCARCTGVMIGQLLGLVSFALPTAWWVSLLLLIPLLLDWSVQEYLLVPSTNTRRLLTGVLGGYGEISFVVFVFLYLFSV